MSQPSSEGGPAGPSGNQPTWGAEPAAPSGSHQAWGAPPDQPTSGQQQWGTPQYPQYPGGGQPGAPGSPPQYPQGGVYNYPPPGGYGEQGPTPPGYGEYPQQSYQPYSTEPQRSGTQVFSIIGFVCAVISVLFCPILFGPAGIVLGIVGHNKGEPLGKWAAITSGVGMIIGFLVGFLIFNGDLRT
ncbi:hypothetical protein ACGFNT_11955 [Nocardia iowensis]